MYNNKLTCISLDIITLKEANPKLKLLISMGGSSEDSENFSMVAANETLIKNLAAEILQFLQNWKFDGFDVNWEYAGLRNHTQSKKNKVISHYN